MEKIRLLFVHTAAILLVIFYSLWKPSAFEFDHILYLLAIAAAGVVSQLIANASLSARKTQIFNLSKELSVASSRIESASEEIRLTIDESDAFTRQLFIESEHMTDQAGRVGRIVAGSVAGFQNLLRLSEETGMMVGDMENTSKDSKAVIAHSLSEILKIVATINLIRESSASASESIETLKATSDAIMEILTKINDISGRMKLISINATIEAARAGSAGNGFSVVAAEFKRLSESTEEASGEIEAQIRTVKRKVDDVRDSIRENDENVGNGVLLSKNVEENLSDINASFHKVINMVERIRSINKEESTVAFGIEAEIGEIVELVRQTGDNADSVCRSAAQQKSGIANIAKMGEKLRAASAELSGLAGSSVDAVWSNKINRKIGEVAQEYFQLIATELACSPDLSDINRHAALISSFMKAHDQVEAAWTNDRNGRFLCSIPEAGIANASVREWFRSSIRGENYVSPIYISGITKNPCVTLSIPSYSHDRKITGVIGIDLDLGKLNIC